YQRKSLPPPRKCQRHARHRSPSHLDSSRVRRVTRPHRKARGPWLLLPLEQIVPNPPAKWHHLRNARRRQSHPGCEGLRIATRVEDTTRQQKTGVSSRSPSRGGTQASTAARSRCSIRARSWLRLPENEVDVLLANQALVRSGSGWILTRSK